MTDPTVLDILNATDAQRREVIRRAKLQAYGVEPNAADYTYWVPLYPGLQARGVEIHIANYAWLRLIGWQATGPDMPFYGPFADPPSALLPFNVPVTPPVVVPPPVPVSDPVFLLLSTINTKLDRLLARQPATYRAMLPAIPALGIAVPAAVVLRGDPYLK